MEASSHCCQPADGATDAHACWLCLCGTEAGPLTLPCKCPSMYSHPMCLGRWQLQQAGREEERSCRFCHSRLPTWTESLLDDPSAQLHTAVPIMAVVFNGRMVKLPCIPGKEGAELFKKQIREIFHLDDSVSLDVTFELKVPAHEESTSGQKVYLKGFHTFEAASTVAAICAAKRMARSSCTSVPGNSPSTSACPPPAIRSISGAPPSTSRGPSEPQFAAMSLPVLPTRRATMERAPSSALPAVAIADTSSASSFSYDEERLQATAPPPQQQQPDASQRKSAGSEMFRKLKALLGLRSSRPIAA